MNSTVLMSGVEFFDDAQAINAFMDSSAKIDVGKAHAEHEAIKMALQNAGVKVVQVSPPVDCQDGVYTANWGLVRGNKAVMSRLPNARKGEEPYAEQVLRDIGKEIYHVPEGLKWSGQGDSLPCGDLLLAGSGYRSDPEAQSFVAEILGYQLVQLRAVPQRNWLRRPVINKASGWPDSFFYDIDLALSVLRFPAGGQKGLIAWCPDAFTPESQQTLRALDEVDKIEISLHEAKNAFACNLVSTGSTVVMSARAPVFKAELEKRGFTVVTPEISELAKGGGYIRCTTLTLDNA